MKFKDVDDVQEKATAIESVVRAWCDWREI
jgi:hypothetical protein